MGVRRDDGAADGKIADIAFTQPVDEGRIRRSAERLLRFRHRVVEQCAVFDHDVIEQFHVAEVALELEVMAARFEDAEDFLLRVRSTLHLEGERNQNVLSHDLQERAAAMLGYPGADSRRQVERLMSDYFRHARVVDRSLRWALREGAVLPEEAIHDVRVLHRFSFVEVDPDQAERTVEFLDGTKLKGKEIRLEIAKS